MVLIKEALPSFKDHLMFMWRAEICL
jgi:TFIIS helical bundle-like domain